MAQDREQLIRRNDSERICTCADNGQGEPTETAADCTVHGLLPGAMINRAWMKTPIGDPIPKEWESGLWGLDAAVEAAIKGGWTDEEITSEVAQLIESYRQPELDDE